MFELYQKFFDATFCVKQDGDQRTLKIGQYLFLSDEHLFQNCNQDFFEAKHMHLSGGSAATNGPDIQARLDELQAEVEYLENLEKKVDEHRSKVLQSLQNVQDDLDNGKFSYVTHQDLVNVFHDRTLLVIRAPDGTNLEVPIPDNPLEQSAHSTLYSMKRMYKVHLKSNSTAIDVMLVNQEEGTEKIRPHEFTRRSARLDEYGPNPLLPLSPPLSDRDFSYTLDESEGLCNLFDVPLPQKPDS